MKIGKLRNCMRKINIFDLHKFKMYVVIPHNINIQRALKKKIDSKIDW